MKASSDDVELRVQHAHGILAHFSLLGQLHPRRRIFPSWTVSIRPRSPPLADRVFKERPELVVGLQTLGKDGAIELDLISGH